MLAKNTNRRYRHPVTCVPRGANPYASGFLRAAAARRRLEWCLARISCEIYPECSMRVYGTHSDLLGLYIPISHLQGLCICHKATWSWSLGKCQEPGQGVEGSSSRFNMHGQMRSCTPVCVFTHVCMHVCMYACVYVQEQCMTTSELAGTAGFRTKP